MSQLNACSIGWYWYFVILIVLCCGAPGFVSAQVLLSEIAWMGTAASPDDEWIELHNRGEDSVDVTGWTIGDDNSLTITLTGTIQGNAFALLERTDDTAVPSVAMFQSYVGALANAGRTLTLRDAGGVTIDTATGGENWTGIGGDNVTKETPQRTSSSGWVVGTPTPGNTNITNSSAPSVSPSTGGAARTSSGRSSTRIERRESVPPPPPEALSLDLAAPTLVYVNQPVVFTLEPHGPGKTILSSLSYVWNFGDTFTDTSKSPTHTFEYPGEYIVVVEAQFAKHSAQARHEITVIPSSFTLTRGQSGELLLKNLSSHEVDLGGYTMKSVASFAFPKFTILKAGGTLTIPATRVGGVTGLVSLHDVAGTRVAEYAEGTSRLASVRSSALAAPATVASVVSATLDDKEESPAQPSEVIRIGEPESVRTEGGAVSRFFKGLVDILGFSI